MTIATTTYPLGLLVHNGFLYVTHFNVGGGSTANNNTITKINLSDNTETTWITADKGLVGPTCMVIHDGYMYVGNLGTTTQVGGFISKISLDNNNPTIDNAWCSIPGHQIFDMVKHNGYFYVSGNKFGRVNIETQIYNQISTNSANFLTLDGNFIYLAGGSTVFKYDLITEAFVSFTTGFTTKIIVYNNTLYITSPNANAVDEFNLTTSERTSWKSTGTFPVNIIIDNGYLYVGNHMGGSISRLVLPGTGGGGIPGGSMGGGGTTDHFFINDPFTISQTATMFSQSLAAPFTNQYDYILDININSVWDSMNNLFTERRFMTEFTHNDSNYDSVHLNVDRTSLASLLTTANVVSISSDNESIYLDHAGVYGTLDNQNGQLAGFRFLEIVATKIFGHAKTKIAIENSDDYYATHYPK